MLYNKNIEYPNRVLDSEKITSELQQDKEYLIEELQQDKEKLIEELGAQISELYSVSDALDRVTSNYLILLVGTCMLFLMNLEQSLRNILLMHWVFFRACILVLINYLIYLLNSWLFWMSFIQLL